MKSPTSPYHRLCLGLLLTVVSIGSLRADSKAGAASADFLRMGAGARYLAMGGAGTAAAEDANALYWNPAGLSRLDRASLSFMYNDDVQSTNQQFVTAAIPAGRMGSVGLSFESFSAGTIPQLDENGQERGNFSPRDTAFGAGWAHRLLRDRFTPGFSLGIGLGAKYIHSTIVNSASTYAADAGLSAFYKNRASLGVSLRNYGGELKFDHDASPLPRSVNVGLAYRPFDFWLLALDTGFSSRVPQSVGAGTEIRVLDRSSVGLALRAGYNSQNKDIEGTKGVTVGLGLSLRRVELDYAWIPMGTLDQTHRISLTIPFPSK